MNFKDKFHYLYLLFSLSIVCILRFHLVDMPLERDEGEYAYMGQLILQGIPPYKLAYNMKLPGTYFFYAIIIKLFGETFRAIHIGFLFVTLLNVTGIYFLTKRILNAKSALFASAAFGIYSSSFSVVGFAFHATHLVFLFFVYGVLVFLEGIEKKKTLYFFLAGILFGLSFLMKQQAIFLLLFSGFYLFIKTFFLDKEKLISQVKKIFTLGLGIFIPFLSVCIYLYFNNVFSEFWFWTFEYASKYVGLNSTGQGFKNLLSSVIGLYKGFELYWILSAVGFLILPLLKLEREKKILLYSLLIFSFLTTVPGFYFRGHYFIPFLPFLCVFASLPLYFLEEKIPNKYASIFCFLILLVGVRNAVQQDKSYYFKDSMDKISRLAYFVSPFPEAVKIAEYIKEHSKESDTITILGSEPEIFFYSNRKSTTGFIYMYPLMEDHKFSLELQARMTKEVNEKKPEFVILVNNELDFFQKNVSKENLVILFDWIENFKKQTDYKKVGVVEILLGETKYTFGDDLSSHKYSSEASIDLYQKVQ